MSTVMPHNSQWHISQQQQQLAFPEAAPHVSLSRYDNSHSSQPGEPDHVEPDGGPVSEADVDQMVADGVASFISSARSIASQVDSDLARKNVTPWRRRLMHQRREAILEELATASDLGQIGDIATRWHQLVSEQMSQSM